MAARSSHAPGRAYNCRKVRLEHPVREQRWPGEAPTRRRRDRPDRSGFPSRRHRRSAPPQSCAMADERAWLNGSPVETRQLSCSFRGRCRDSLPWAWIMACAGLARGPSPAQQNGTGLSSTWFLLWQELVVAPYARDGPPCLNDAGQADSNRGSPGRSFRNPSLFLNATITVGARLTTAADCMQSRGYALA